MESALAKARLIVNEMKGTVWRSTGTRPNGARAGAIRDNVADHEGFALAGCPGAVDDQSSQAPTPFPVGNSRHIERFLQKRAEVTRGLSQHIQEITDHAPAGLPAVQAASCLLRECIPQRSIHLLRVLGSDSTKEFCISVDEIVLKAAKRILDLPELLVWQNEALFIPVDRGGWGLWKLEQRRHTARIGGMIAAEAPTKEQNDSDLRTLALENLMIEDDALSAAFDVEAFDILRRTPADLALGALTGGQPQAQRAVSGEPNIRAWMDGASGSDENGAETAPGASAWVQARPVGHEHPPWHPLQDRHSPPFDSPLVCP